MPGLIPRLFIMVASFIAAFLTAAPAIAQLPPRIMADRYLIKAEQLESEKDFTGALKAIGKAIALQQKHGFKLPVEFHFKYARIALSADSIRIAYESVNRYLSIAGPDGEFYKEALALSLEAEGPEILSEEKCTGKPVGSSCWMQLANRPECYVWNGNLKEDETATWSGGCVQGVATGDGTLTWAIFEADSNRVTQSITGPWRKGRRSDDGRFVWRTSDYTAEIGFVNGKRHGPFVVRRSNGSGDEGTFENGKRHGQWTHRDSDGNTEAGPYENGKRHGQWIFQESDGRSEERTYKNGNRISTLTGGDPATNAPTDSGSEPTQSQGGHSQGATAQEHMQQALQKLESACGEKYQSRIAPNDHVRFYCLAAFNDYCALKSTQNDEARRQLRARLAKNCEVLEGFGAASKCPYCQ